MITPYKAKTDIKPYYVSVLDIETDPDGNVIGIGFAWEDVYMNRKYRAFHNWDEWYPFFVELFRKSDPITQRNLKRIYAHNGNSFDWLSLIEWAHENNLIERMKYIYTSGFGIGVDIQLGEMKIRLRDSVRLMPGSLDMLCKTFDTPHKKLDLDELPHETLARDPALYWAYLQNDVLALQEVVFGFWEKIYQKVGSVENLPMTLPALSLKLWRMTLTDDIMTPSNARLKKLERRCYTGGRTECYSAGTATVTCYDANSEYPAIMLRGIFPLSYAGGFVAEYNGEHGIYDIEYIQHDTTRKPVLRDETTNEFLYAGSGVYCQPEIEELMQQGGEIVVKGGYVFTQMGNPFREFITDWWATRLKAQREKDTAFAYVCKILMNSLYGKMGQREDGWTLHLLTADEQIAMMEAGTRMKIVGDFTLVYEPDRKSEHTFVSIAAYVTSQARLLLYSKMKEAETKGGKIWMVDTDSVHVEGAELETGDGLGEWKKEYSCEAVYLGKKLYALADGTIKAKGIGKTGRSVLNYDSFKEILQTGEGLEVDFITFPTFKEVILSGRKSCKPTRRTRTIRATSNRQK